MVVFVFIFLSHHFSVYSILNNKPCVTGVSPVLSPIVFLAEIINSAFLALPVDPHRIFLTRALALSTMRQRQAHSEYIFGRAFFCFANPPGFEPRP